jgi:hypothetical protein
MSLLPTDSAERKRIPLFSGLIRYFPSALIGVSRVSYEGNRKHNGDAPLSHDRSKSNDELDALVRHVFEVAVGLPLQEFPGVEIEDHIAWRALAYSQKQKEARGAPLAPAATNVAKADPATPIVTAEMAAIMLRDKAVAGESDE